ncbi:SatD family protein [Nocardioides piscis]|uniref:Winged helix-turn-helix transcriptional regulator n=1 Tax=Nocardioides piscis TaxID=2714938 RepID=A0A6G7YHI3_9ACTN|nr:SatD family protein [Nocardioides piscis]QIK76077.1 winged helix-turn-helix transcriptional regulator [Nocardioides piscis]
MSSIALIGDLVGSRHSGDRRALHRVLQQALDDVNTALEPSTPLRITLGDEHQGVFDSLGDAITASLLVRLSLLPEHDIRHGIGRGSVEVLTEDPRVEDGPGWWAARAAIEAVSAAEGRAAQRSQRTAYVAADPSEVGRAGEVAAVNAGLLLRDQLVTGLSPRSLSVLRGLLAGQTQRDLADRLDISPSAVSQRVRADGLGAIVAAHELMGGLP